MYQNNYQAYKQQSVMTMTTGDMLSTLYDAAIKELSAVKIEFEKENITEINRRLKKVQGIFTYMQKSLDFKYEVAKNLDLLYDYFIRVCRNANIHKDPSELDGVIEMVSDLRDTYAQADKKVRAAEA